MLKAPRRCWWLRSLVVFATALCRKPPLLVRSTREEPPPDQDSLSTVSTESLSDDSPSSSEEWELVSSTASVTLPKGSFRRRMTLP